VTVIIGPTAGGKTALAVRSAKLMAELAGVSGEVISADSMLLYRGLNIGSAKPTEDEREGVVHHLIDVCDPREGYSVSHWLTAAERAICEIRARGAWPIVVGGTHLYVKALLEGLFEGPGADEKLRESLYSLGREELRARLEACDPVSAARLHPNDLRRTVRALEVFTLTGTPISAHQRQWDQTPEHNISIDRCLVGLDWSVEAINRRINARVKLMFERGLENEVRGLYAAGALGPQSREAVGYKQMIDYFEGRLHTLEEAVERIKIDTRHLAKAQRTWAKRLRTTAGSLWIDAQVTPEPQWPSLVVDHTIRLSREGLQSTHT
jgi:tRNA dimethylallyltransferase